MATLDANTYPHLFEQIVQDASFETQMVVRLVSRRAREVADRAMVAYIALGANLEVDGGDFMFHGLQIRDPAPPFWQVPTFMSDAKTHLGKGGVVGDRMTELAPYIRCVDFYGTGGHVNGFKAHFPSATVRDVWVADREPEEFAIVAPRSVQFHTCSQFRCRCAIAATSGMVPASQRFVKYLRIDAATARDAEQVFTEHDSSVTGTEEGVFVLDVFYSEGRSPFLDKFCEGIDNRPRGPPSEDDPFDTRESEPFGCLMHLPFSIAGLLASGVRVTVAGLEEVPIQLLALGRDTRPEDVRARFLHEVHKGARELIQRSDIWGIYSGGEIDLDLLKDITPVLHNLTFPTLDEWRSSADWRDYTLPPIPQQWVGWRLWDHRNSLDSFKQDVVPFTALPAPYVSDSDEDFLPPIFD